MSIIDQQYLEERVRAILNEGLKKLSSELNGAHINMTHSIDMEHLQIITKTDRDRNVKHRQHPINISLVIEYDEIGIRSCIGDSWK